MSTFVFGPFRLDASTRELRKQGAQVGLPPRVFACLLFLIERRERAVGRDELIEAMWDGRSASDVQLAQLILQCRRAVDDDGQAQRAIRTIAGFGYRWVEALAPEEKPQPALPSAERAAAIAIDAVAEASALDARSIVATAVSRWRRHVWAVLLLALVAIGAAAFALRDRGGPSPRGSGRVLVLPVQVDADDASWLRLGGLDVVVEQLRRNRVPVLSSESSVALLQTLAVDARSGIETAARLRDAADAEVVVGLDVHRDGGGWRVDARLHRRDGAPLQLDARADDAIAALRALADRLSNALGYPVAEPGVAVGAVAGAVELTLQQARAALLANQPQQARELLLANPALAHSEPLLRQQLADVDIRAGRYAEARTALDALLATPGGEARFRAQLLNARGMVSVRGGRFAEAGADFSAAIDLLGEQGDAVTLGRAYLGRGISRTSLQDYAGALSDDARARAIFERSGDVGSVARVDSNIGALEILRGHMAQAEPYLQRALERFRELGFVQEQVNTLQLAFVAARTQLKSEAAAATMDQLWRLRPRIVSPSSQWSVGLYRVEWLLWQGRGGEAAALLDSLMQTAQPAAQAERERLHVMRATLDRSVDRPEQALLELDTVPEDAQASADDDSVRADATLLRARLQRELARSVDADVHAAAAVAIATPNPRTPLRLLAQANRALAQGNTAAAERAFAAALTLADEQGVPLTVAAVAIDYAGYLLTAQRVSEASAIAGRVALWVDTDFDCALLQLRVAHAAHQPQASAQALARVRRLAGERPIPDELVDPVR